MVFFAYLLANAPHGTLYCGHTESLAARIPQHREKVFAGFTAKYGVTRLVWFEAHDTRDGAFRREQQIKKWNRAWKVRLIEAGNPTWGDLFEELFRPEQPLHPDLASFVDPMTRLPFSSAHPREGGDP
ncbi:GIY-YIG nuclease family protein [Phenylobacterium sp.]|uniref:GIY-YIG nuclease family protein n=1 Tax=Phenylobacterium sp. TaxID=1871053 RepID=UPI002F3FD57B